MILSTFSVRYTRLVGIVERLRVVASDSFELSLSEYPRGGDGGSFGPWQSSECGIKNVGAITSVLRPTVAKQ